MNVLVVAAHPDDEVLGCGGTIARLSQEGHDIHVAVLGEGITSRYRRREEADRNLLEDLHEKSLRSAKILGVNKIRMYDLPDNRFDTVPLLDIVKILEDQIQETNPSRIYTHHSSDLNLDHSLTNRATLIATRPLKDTQVKAVLAYEVPSSTEWSFSALQPDFRPNVFLDISATLEKKIQAMKIYDGELREYPHPRSSQALTAIAQRWGSVSGTGAAEAFALIRYIDRNPER